MQKLKRFIYVSHWVPPSVPSSFTGSHDDPARSLATIPAAELRLYKPIGYKARQSQDTLLHASPLYLVLSLTHQKTMWHHSMHVVTAKRRIAIVSCLSVCSSLSLYKHMQSTPLTIADDCRSTDWKDKQV